MRIMDAERALNMKHLFVIPATVPFYAGGLITSAALSILSFGMSKKVNYWSDTFAKGMKHIFPLILQSSIGVVNPGAGVMIYEDSFGDAGVLTKIFVERLRGYAKEAADDEDFFKRHIITRISYLLSSPIALVTRICDLALGILVLPAVFVTYCRAEEDDDLSTTAIKIHSFAMEQMTFCSLINDICVSLRGLENPRQFVQNR